MSPCGPSCLPVLVLVLSLSLWPCPVQSYANGRVTKACSSMEPHHHSQGQTSPSPYQLHTNVSSFSPGEHVEVTLSGQFFEGFLLQARDPAQDASSAVGTFTLTDPHSTQLLTCNKLQGSAVSHTSKSRKNLVRVIWKAPRDAPIQVTVVSHYDIYWVKIPGPIITHMEFSTTFRSQRCQYFSSEGCGQSKSCLLDPPGCDPSRDPRCFYLSAAAQGPPQQQSVVFELSGPAEGYIAFALSWDTWMGDDDTYLCVNADGRVSVEAAILRGRTHPEEETQSGLQSVSWRIADGIIQCRFSRLVKPTNPESEQPATSSANQEPERFDLEREYFLFVASGPAHRGQIGRHDQQPLVSEHRVRLTGTPIMLRGSRGPTLLKVHGGLMLLAWMLTGSLGTFIASFYKNHWSSRTLFGQKVWFQVHRGLMVLTVALTAAGFSLPFVYRRGWSKRAGVHPYLGCCVLALSLLQPITACVRPPPDSPRRYIFNWLHWAVGSITEVMAVATMFLGVGQSSLPLPSSLATHILIGYVSWLWLQGDDQRAILSDQSETAPRIPGSNPGCVVLVLGKLGLLSALLFCISQL
ncbi:hypothetical protein WMY93_000321 [Mugilogobius chulae]|uniref:Ferric-chelate reductase 1 n=1 Tax=Mugilogobius chulae TaxID=88201 RepID=A0AAW0Q0J7_9GOBI